MVETTQADRDAAAALANEICGCADRNQHRRDVELAIQFREVALLEGGRIERARVVAWLRSEQGKGSDAGIDYAEDFADAIERGGHSAKGE